MLGRWLICLLFHFWVSHKWVVASSSLAVVLGHCLPTRSNGIPGCGHFSWGCWADRHKVSSTLHVPSFLSSLGLHLIQEMEIVFKNGRGSKNLLEWITGDRTLLIYLLPLVDWRFSQHHALKHSHIEGADKEMSLQNFMCPSVPSVNILSLTVYDSFISENGLLFTRGDIESLSLHANLTLCWIASWKFLRSHWLPFFPYLLDMVVLGHTAIYLYLRGTSSSWKHEKVKDWSRSCVSDLLLSFSIYMHFIQDLKKKPTLTNAKMQSEVFICFSSGSVWKDCS